jgi:hypothetical protein
MKGRRRRCTLFAPTLSFFFPLCLTWLNVSSQKISVFTDFTLANWLVAQPCCIICHTSNFFLCVNSRQNECMFVHMKSFFL